MYMDWCDKHWCDMHPCDMHWCDNCDMHPCDLHWYNMHWSLVLYMDCDMVVWTS